MSCFILDLLLITLIFYALILGLDTFLLVSFIEGFNFGS